MNDYRNFQRRNAKRRNGKGKHGQNSYRSGKHCIQRKNTYSNIFSATYNHSQNTCKSKKELHNLLHSNLKITNKDTHVLTPARSKLSVNHVNKVLNEMNANMLEWANLFVPEKCDSHVAGEEDFLVLNTKRENLRTQEAESSSAKNKRVLEMVVDENVKQLVIGVVSPMDGHRFELRKSSTRERLINRINTRMNDNSPQFEDYFEGKQFFNEISSNVLINNIVKPYFYPYEMFKLLSLSRSIYYYIMSESVCKLYLNMLKNCDFAQQYSEQKTWENSNNTGGNKTGCNTNNNGVAIGSYWQSIIDLLKNEKYGKQVWKYHVLMSDVNENTKYVYNCIVAGMKSFCKSMMNYVSEQQHKQNIIFRGYVDDDQGYDDTLTFGTKRQNKIEVIDINKWNNFWKTLFGYDILSLIRSMFMYTILFVQHTKNSNNNNNYVYIYDNDNNGYRVINLANDYKNRCVYLHILNPRMMNLLSYYCELPTDNAISNSNSNSAICIKHEFQQIRLNDKITLHFIYDCENHLNWDVCHARDRSFKRLDELIKSSSLHGMRFADIGNDAANVNELLYWKYSTTWKKSSILQCFSTVKMARFHNLHYHSYSKKTLKFFNFCKVFEYFDKIAIEWAPDYPFRGFRRHIYKQQHFTDICDWIRNVCHCNPGDKKSNYTNQWIVIRRLKQKQKPSGRYRMNMPYHPRINRDRSHRHQYGNTRSGAYPLAVDWAAVSTRRRTSFEKFIQYMAIQDET